MPRATLEIADVLRVHGQRWREQHAGHISLAQLRVMSALTHCRTDMLGGHKLQCLACEHMDISYNSCRNRHCPKCQASSAKRWLDARQAQLLPVDYYHVVFTLPAQIAELAYYNKSLMYDVLMKTAAQTITTIGADPKRLGAQLGVTLVLHTWGSSLTHHPHVHGIVPGGGLSLDGKQWVACKSGFFLPVRVLSRLFRRLYLDNLFAAHQRGQLQFFAHLSELEEESAFVKWLAPLRKLEWVVYAKQPFAGPKAVLAYLSRYTHRVAISNSRLVSMDSEHIQFRCKNYRANARKRYGVMSLSIDEFIRRFLLHVLPSGFHRIRHYGLISNKGCKKNLAKVRTLLNVKAEDVVASVEEKDVGDTVYVCSECGGPMVIKETLLSQLNPRASPTLH